MENVKTRGLWNIKEFKSITDTKVKSALNN